MCGIVGGISRKAIDLDLMLDAIKHRGPDGFGKKHFITDRNFNIYLGHRRLSIIDITDNSSQPFSSNNSSYTIVFNGEIYNYKELKITYLSDFNFKSSGDTEVILELFNKYGTESFKWLKGMFAFSIYDNINCKMYLCRDSIGIKPFYYYANKTEFYFASEISALKTQQLDFTICKDSVIEFILNGFIYEPNTGFENIKKVFPGSYLEITFDTDLCYVETKFWKPLIKPELDVVNSDLTRLVKKEYGNHLVSDVPIGLFYSGGIDSSVLMTLGNNEVVPYFINSKSDVKESKELHYAKEIAKTLDREFVMIDLTMDNKEADKLLLSIQHVAKKSEELIADYTFFVSELISTKARENGNKVMLSGMGGDEIFLGYPRYRLIKYKILYKTIFLFVNKLLTFNKKFSKKIDRFKAFFEDKDFIFQYTNLIGYFQEKELKDIIVNYNPSSLKIYEDKLTGILKDYNLLSQVKKAQILDLYGFLSHNFMVADKSSMQASVEMRLPLATPDLFQQSINANADILMDFRNTKKPLLSILKEKLSLGLFSRPKEGFNPDLENLVSTIGTERISLLLNSDKLLTYIKKEFVDNLINEHINGVKNHSYRIYQLLYFKYWLDFNDFSETNK
ncbi:asparagine synthase (glutamine-hydrolyzing) [Aquirufa nivalisilvae]